MQPAKILPHAVIECPNCKGKIDIEWYVGNVVSGKTANKEFTTSCAKCDSSFDLVVTDRENITYQLGTQNPSAPKTQAAGLMLVKHYRDDVETYLVVENNFYYHGKDKPNTDLTYWIDEHTCPINWLNVRMIADSGDCDPHGVFRFIAGYTYEEIKAKFGYERHFLKGDCDDNVAEEEALVQIFPEIRWGALIHEHQDEWNLEKHLEGL